MERKSSSASKRTQLTSPSMDGKFARMYDLEETIGKGHYAVVKLARHVFTGERVAVKVIDKTRLDEASKAQLYQEIRCMKMVQHPIVVRLYEVIDTQTKLYLVLEYGDGGDLYDYIMKHEHGVEEAAAKRYFRQIIRAISYCHQLHVVHRDLKPENVVFFKKLGLVKLTDFGFSNKFNPGQKLATSCGSLAYSAPEILLGDQYDAPAVDIWSLGVILYMLVCGRPPFQEATDNETLTMIMDCKYTIPSHVSRDCRRLISRMLQRDPAKRATLQSIAEDAWLCEPGDASKYEDYLPLVSRHHLNDEEHSEIIAEMVNGGVAAEEEIHGCMEKDDYNHVTATYYLLAEKRLRSRRLETLKNLSAEEKEKQQQQQLQPPRRRSITSTRSDSVCSLTKTKSAENILSDDDASSDGGLGRGNPSSLDDLDALKTALKEESPSSSSSTGSSPARSGGRDAGQGSKSMQLPIGRKLHPVKSSPQLVLNEICEEDESDGTSDGSRNIHCPPSYSNLVAPSRQPSVQKSTASRPSTIGIGPSTGARCRLTKRQFARKLPSCSSSDASDDDSEVKAKKNPFLWRRRDSQEDSSDDPASANGAARKVVAKFPPPPPPPPQSSSSSSSTPQQAVPETVVGSKGALIGSGALEHSGKMCLQRRHSSNDVWRSRPAGRRFSVMRQSQSLSRIGELHVLILDASKTKRAASADGFASSRPRMPIQPPTSLLTGPRVVLSTSRHNSDSESNTEDVGAVAAVSSHTKRRHHHHRPSSHHHHSVAGKENDGRRLVPVPEAGEHKEKEEALSSSSATATTSTTATPSGKKRSKIKAFLDKRKGTGKSTKQHHHQHHHQEKSEHEALGGGKACNMT